jgi:hypothetical protein
MGRLTTPSLTLVGVAAAGAGVLALWVAMLAEPLVFGSYYLVYLVRGSGGVG